MKIFKKISEENEIYCTAGKEYCMVTSTSDLYRCNCYWNYFVDRYDLKDYEQFDKDFDNNLSLACKKYECYNRNCDTYFVETWKNNKIINYDHSIFWRKKYSSINEVHNNGHFFIHCEPVKGCPNKCPYCAIHLTGQHKVTSMIDVSLFEEFLSYFARKKQGMKLISFAGAGEPFLHDNFEQLVDISIKLGYHVHITTSALHFVDKIFKVKDLSNITMNVSLHPSSHKWDEKKVLTFISKLKANKCSICTTMVQYDKNIMFTDDLENKIKSISRDIAFIKLDYVDHLGIIKKVLNT